MSWGFIHSNTESDFAYLPARGFCIEVLESQTRHNSKTFAMKLFLALSLLVASAHASCTTTVLDFNDLAAGATPSMYKGVSIAGSPKKAMIFDTAFPTGNDFDLATSNLGKFFVVLYFNS